MNIFNILKANRKIKIVFFVILILISVIFYINSNIQNKKVEISKTPVDVVYKNLVVGKSTKEDIYNKFGEPESRIVDGEKELLEFKSNNPNFNNELKLKAGTFVFAKEIIAPIDKIDIKKIKDQYGEEDTVLYPPGAGIYVGLFIYLDEGIAYRGNYFTGDLTEIWYFEPTNIESFKSLYAPDYLDSPEIGQ